MRVLPNTPPDSTLHSNQVRITAPQCSRHITGVSQMCHLVPMEVGDLPALVRAAQQSEPRAVDRLLTVIRPSLVRYFRRRLPAEVADDLVQIARLE